MKKFFASLAAVLFAASIALADGGDQHSTGSGASSGPAAEIESGTTTIASGTNGALCRDDAGVFKCDVVQVSDAGTVTSPVTGSSVPMFAGPDWKLFNFDAEFFGIVKGADDPAGNGLFVFRDDAALTYGTQLWAGGRQAHELLAPENYTSERIITPGSDLSIRCFDSDWTPSGGGVINDLPGTCEIHSGSGDDLIIFGTDELRFGTGAGIDTNESWKIENDGDLTSVGAGRDLTSSGILTMGTAPTQVTDATGKVLAAAVNDISESQVTNLVNDLSTLAAGQGQGGNVGSYLVSGCAVAWSGSGLIFDVSACTYRIQGALYTSAATQLTLTAADGSLNRIDSIVVNTTPAAAKVDGTAAASPSEPSLDPATQLKLINITVPAAATTPSGFANEIVYDEDNDWTCTGDTGWNCASTTNPHAGTKDVEATSVAAATKGKFVRSSAIEPSQYSLLVFWIRSKSSWNAGRSLAITLRLAGVQKGQTVTFQNSSFGFNSGNTSSYQLISIPMSGFAIPAGTLIDEVRFTAGGSGGSAIGFYLDDVLLQASANTVTQTGITQEAADARYLPRGSSYATQYKDASGFLNGTGPGTSGQVLTSTGTSTAPTFQTPTSVYWIPVASCQNTTAALLWDSPTSNAPSSACVTGSNTQKGVAEFDASTDESLQMTLRLPASYSGGNIDGKIIWLATATSGSAGLCIQLVCTADAETDDPSFPSQASGNCVSDAAKGTTLQTNIATLSNITKTGCAADELLHIRLSRDADGGAVTDDMTGDARVIGVELTVPRQ